MNSSSLAFDIPGDFDVALITWKAGYDDFYYITDSFVNERATCTFSVRVHLWISELKRRLGEPVDFAVAVSTKPSSPWHNRPFRGAEART